MKRRRIKLRKFKGKKALCQHSTNAVTYQNTKVISEVNFEAAVEKIIECFQNNTQR